MALGLLARLFGTGSLLAGALAAFLKTRRRKPKVGRPVAETPCPLATSGPRTSSSGSAAEPASSCESRSPCSAGHERECTSGPSAGASRHGHQGTGHSHSQGWHRLSSSYPRLRAHPHSAALAAAGPAARPSPAPSLDGPASSSSSLCGLAPAPGLLSRRSGGLGWGLGLAAGAVGLGGGGGGWGGSGGGWGPGRPSDSLEYNASCSGDTVDSGCTGGGGGEEGDSSEEAEAAEGGGADARGVYGKSDRARLVDLWIESALLVSRDVRLGRRHFDRGTRQNLKKMRPGSAQGVLAEIAERSWEGTPTADIAKEVHRLVSHAKAQDKYAAAQVAGLGAGGGVGLGGRGQAAALAALSAGAGARFA